MGTETKSVAVERTENASAGVVELDLDFSGFEYSGYRWAETPRGQRGGCGVVNYPFALLVGGAFYLHNAVVEAAYLCGEGKSITYGRGRNAARYELIAEDVILNLATREVRTESGARKLSDRERSKEEGIRAAFAAIVEVL